MGFGGVRFHGKVGELWAYGVRSGLLYDWALEGFDGKWRVDAERYKLDPLVFRNGNRGVEVRVEVAGSLLCASGNIWSDFHADGQSHRGLVIKGGRIWQDRRAAPATT